MHIDQIEQVRTQVEELRKTAYGRRLLRSRAARDLLPHRILYLVVQNYSFVIPDPANPGYYRTLAPTTKQRMDAAKAAAPYFAAHMTSKPPGRR